MTRGALRCALTLISLPSRRIESPGLARSPSFATWPRTVTRPAEIQPSISLREPKPAAASSFCSRSPAGTAEASAAAALALLAGGWRGGFVGGLLSNLRGSRWFKLERPGDLLKGRQLLQ